MDSTVGFIAKTCPSVFSRTMWSAGLSGPVSTFAFQSSTERASKAAFTASRRASGVGAVTAAR